MGIAADKTFLGHIPMDSPGWSLVIEEAESSRLGASALRELQAACDADKPLLLLHETDPTKHGQPLEELREIVRLECRHELCGSCFSEISALPSSRMTRAGASIECPMCRKHARRLESPRSRR